MTSEEKRVWIFGPVSILSYLGYLAAVTIGGVDYAPAMLWSVGIAIVVNIVLHIAVTIRSPREPRLSAVLASTAKIAAYRYGLPREHAW